MKKIKNEVDEIISVIKSGCEDFWAVAYQMSLSLEKGDKEYLNSSIICIIETLPEEEKCDAIRCIPSFGRKSFIKYLNSVILNDSSGLVRSCACWVLQNVGDETSIESLCSVLLTDIDSSVKIAAIDTLTFLNAKNAINVLQQICQKPTSLEEDVIVQEAALEALQHLSRTAPTMLRFEK